MKKGGKKTLSWPNHLVKLSGRKKYTKWVEWLNPPPHLCPWVKRASQMPFWKHASVPLFCHVYSPDSPPARQPLILSMVPPLSLLGFLWPGPLCCLSSLRLVWSLLVSWTISHRVEGDIELASVAVGRSYGLHVCFPSAPRTDHRMQVSKHMNPYTGCCWGMQSFWSRSWALWSLRNIGK